MKTPYFDSIRKQVDANRRVGGRLSSEIWDEIVSLVEVYGVGFVSKKLRLSVSSIYKHLARNRQSCQRPRAPTAKPRPVKLLNRSETLAALPSGGEPPISFVEIGGLAAASACPLSVEIKTGQKLQVRIQCSAADLSAVGRLLHSLEA